MPTLPPKSQLNTPDTLRPILLEPAPRPDLLDTTTYRNTMKPLATFLAVILPCACPVILALMHILRAKSTMDQSDSDPMCLAYIYVSCIFYLLHSRLV